MLADPSSFLAAAREAEPGWSAPYGGAAGVAQLTTELQGLFHRQAKECAELRSAAVGQLSRDRWTYAAIGEFLGGMTSQAVGNILRRYSADEDWAARLAADDAW